MEDFNMRLSEIISSLLNDNRLTDSQKLAIKYLVNRNDNLSKLLTYLANSISDGSVIVKSGESLSDIMNNLNSCDENENDDC
jgi:hypothetical protein